MSGRTRKILVRIAVLGMTLWAGRDAVDTIQEAARTGEGSRLALRIAVVLQQLKGAEPARGVDGGESADAETEIVVTSPKRPHTADAAGPRHETDPGLTPEGLCSGQTVDLRGRLALSSPPARAPPVA